MSEQVMRSVGLDGREYVPADDYDALHAEAEALRAEIEELDTLRNRQSDLLSQTAIALRGPEPALTRYSHADIPSRVKEVVAQFEAARGLLERVTTAVNFEAYGSALHDVRAFLTATPAPEVQSEQGERQEAIGLIGQSHIVVGRFPIWNTEDGSVPDAGTMLYTNPQPGPDVRGLVEALEAVHERFGPCRGDFIFSKRHALDKVAAALAAHRQAQQGGSHDT
ncbi:hypothetical protein [Leptolyngbya phage Lbo-JY16]